MGEYVVDKNGAVSWTPTMGMERERLDRAHVWLRRARLDFVAFEHLFPKQVTHGGVNRPSDAALGVYLLQQAIEKAIKAVIIASGRFTEEKIRRRYGHKSLLLFLDFYLVLLKDGQFSQFFDEYSSSIIGLSSSGEAVERMETIIRWLKGEKEENWELEFWEQLTYESPEGVYSAMSKLEKDRQSMLQRVRGVVPRGVRLNLENINARGGALEDNLSLMIADALCNSGLKPDEKASISGYLRAFIPVRGADDFEESNTQLPKRVIIRRRLFEERVLATWAMGSLLILAGLTFPHENSTRYPAPIDVMKTGPTSIHRLGFESYTEELGIVKHVAYVRRVAKMTLTDMQQMLGPIAEAFSALAMAKDLIL